MESYWREGLHGLSVNEICRRARISKPGLYRDFGGEDGLMDAVLAHYADAVLGPVLAKLALDRPFSEGLADLVAWMTTRRGTPPGCLLARMRSAPDRLGPATAARVASLEAGARAAYRAWYERARDRGEVRAAIDPDLAAHYIDTQLGTGLYLMAAGEDPAQVRAQVELAFASLRP